MRALASFARMTLPDRLKALGAVLLDRPPALVVPGALIVALGAWLSWLGYCLTAEAAVYARLTAEAAVCGRQAARDGDRLRGRD